MTTYFYCHSKITDIIVWTEDNIIFIPKKGRIRTNECDPRSSKQTCKVKRKPQYFLKKSHEPNIYIQFNTGTHSNLRMYPQIEKNWPVFSWICISHLKQTNTTKSRIQLSFKTQNSKYNFIPKQGRIRTYECIPRFENNLPLVSWILIFHLKQINRRKSRIQLSFETLTQHIYFHSKKGTHSNLRMYPQLKRIYIIFHEYSSFICNK